MAQDSEEMIAWSSGQAATCPVSFYFNVKRGENLNLLVNRGFFTNNVLPTRAVKLGSVDLIKNIPLQSGGHND